jgi:hypothetical protein
MPPRRWVSTKSGHAFEISGIARSAESCKKGVSDVAAGELTEHAAFPAYIPMVVVHAPYVPKVVSACAASGIDMHHAANVIISLLIDETSIHAMQIGYLWFALSDKPETE